jgi:hypothetical protein
MFPYFNEYGNDRETSRIISMDDRNGTLAGGETTPLVRGTPRRSLCGCCAFVMADPSKKEEQARWIDEAPQSS